MKNSIAFLSLLAFAFVALGLTTIDKQEIDDINILENGGFENGLARWTNTGAASFGKVTSGSNLLIGSASASWDASVLSDALTSAQATVPGVLQGRMCEAKFRYKGGDTSINAEVINGATDVLASWKLQNNAVGLQIATVARTEVITFPCPSSGTVAFRLTASSNAAILFLDGVLIGRLNAISVSQSEIYGTADHAETASCEWSNSPGGTYTSFAVDSDCPVPTLTANAVAPATKIPAISFDSLESATYAVSVSFRGITQGGSAGDRCQYVISDGTSVSQGVSISVQGSEETFFAEGVFDFPLGAANTTFELQAKTVVGTPNCAINLSLGSAHHWVVRKYPGATQTIRAIDSEQWLVDISMGGSNPSLGTGAVSSYAEIADTGLDLIQDPKSIPTKIACAGTELSQGATCSISESVGIVFDLPVAGSVMSCVTFPYVATIQDGSLAGVVELAFQQVLTVDGSQAIIQEGGAITYAHWLVHPPASGDGSSRHTTSVYNCTVFNFASVGTKVIRVMREQVATINAIANVLKLDRAPLTGQQDLSWTVIPLSNNFPSIQTLNPVIFGSEFQQASSDSLSTTTSLSPIEKLKLTTSSIPAGTYRIGYTATYEIDTTNQVVTVIIEQADTTQLDTVQSDFVDAADEYSIGGFAYVVLGTGIHFFDIDFHASGAASVAGIKNARLEIWRVE